MEKLLLAMKIQSTMLASLGQLIYWQTSILSGAKRQTEVGIKDSKEWRPLNKEEQLEHDLGIMSGHCRNIWDCSEALKEIK